MNSPPMTYQDIQERLKSEFGPEAGAMRNIDGGRCEVWFRGFCLATGKTWDAAWIALWN